MATSVISNTITDPTGAAISGVPVTVTLMPTAGFRVSDASEVARTVSATTDNTGTWSLALEQTANITPSNSYYEVVEFIPAVSGGTRVWTIQVGNSNQSVSAALVTPLPAAQASGFLTQAAADARYQALGAFGNVTTSVPGDSASAGVATSSARSDHKHGREAAPVTAAVATSQTTASASYTDLATSGPAVTVTTGTKALVTVYGQLSNNTIGSSAFMGFAVSGASTVAAADASALQHTSSVANHADSASATFLVTGLTAGSNVFTAKYRASANTATFANRSIVVVPVS